MLGVDPENVTTSRSLRLMGPVDRKSHDVYSETGCRDTAFQIEYFLHHKKYAGNEIYFISGLVRWLHPKVGIAQMHK